MRCPYCGREYKVDHSDRGHDTVNIRQCVCKSCGGRFVTMEQIIRIEPGKKPLVALPEVGK